MYWKYHESVAIPGIFMSATGTSVNTASDASGMHYVSRVSSHLVNSHFVNSHFVNFTSSIPTLSISHFVNSHLVNVDEVGIDKVGS